MLSALDRVLLLTRDVDAAARSYAHLLGRNPDWRGALAEAGAESAVFRLANASLELFAPPVSKPGAPARTGSLAARLEREGEGVLGLCFATPDLRASREALRARGLPASEPIEGSTREPGPGRPRRWRALLLGAEATRGIPLLAVESLDQGSFPAGSELEEPEGQGGLAVEALDHVVIASSDLDASLALYRDRLGLRLALDRRFEGRGLRLCFLRVGGVTVELAGRLDQPADRDAPDRFFGLAWRVGDADAARDRIAGAGFDVSAVRPGRKPGTRVCTVRSRTAGVPTLLIGPGRAGA